MTLATGNSAQGTAFYDTEGITTSARTAASRNS